MTVKKLFWEDPYLKEHIATITSIDENGITLDETIIYAFSGGQASDSGTMNDHQIIEAQKVEKEIYYRLDTDQDLKVGDTVNLVIDWEKRYKIMRLHFAAEIILELMTQYFHNPKKIGANITSDKARVDFEWEGNISAAFPLLEERSKEIIKADIPIISAFSDEEKEIRYWQIDGFAKVPCGGTHIKRTGEIGEIRLKRGKGLGKNKERIEIYLTA